LYSYIAHKTRSNIFLERAKKLSTLLYSCKRRFRWAIATRNYFVWRDWVPKTVPTLKNEDDRLSPELRAITTLLNFCFAFDDGDVAIDGKIGEALDLAAGQGPSYFEPVNFGAFSEAQDDTWIVRGEVATAANFHA